MSEWQPIETAPREHCQFLVTQHEAGDPWACEIELVCGPFLEDGRILNQNSGNYTRAGHWTHWMPLPAPPASADSNASPPDGDGENMCQATAATSGDPVSGEGPLQSNAAEDA